MDGRRKSRIYTNADRVAALAALELNVGNLSKTVRQTGVPIGTLSLWRNAALSADPERALKPLEVEKTDWAALFGDALRESVRLLRAAMPTMGGRDLAVTTGILTDKYPDFTQGRKAGFMLDQSQHLTVPPGTTLADIDTRIDALRSGQ